MEEGLWRRRCCPQLGTHASSLTAVPGRSSRSVQVGKAPYGLSGGARRVSASSVHRLSPEIRGAAPWLPVHSPSGAPERWRPACQGLRG